MHVPWLHVSTEYTDLDHVSYDGKPGWPRREVWRLPGGDVQQYRHQSQQYPLYHLGENLQDCEHKVQAEQDSEFSLACLLQGVTKRCRLSLLTNRALVNESQCWGIRGIAGSQPTSTAVHITWHGAQINFGNLPYLTYGLRPLLS